MDPDAIENQKLHLGQFDNDHGVKNILRYPDEGTCSAQGITGKHKTGLIIYGYLWADRKRKWPQKRNPLAHS